MARIPIGLELWSVRHDLKADPLGTLKKIKAMGYEGVEFAGAYEYAAADVRQWLDETGLVCCGWHTAYPLVQDDQLEATIEYNKIIGNTRIIVPSIPGNLRQTKADWLALARRFDALAAKLAAHGMMTGYHNHHVEFAPLEGEAPWETFFGATGQGVAHQIDTGNCYRGGGDPVALVKKFPGRSNTVHLKPYTFSLDTPDDPKAPFGPAIGEDETPWADFFAACESVGGTQWYIVEYESDAIADKIVAVRKNIEALRKMGK